MRQPCIISPERELFSINSQIHSHLGEKLCHLRSNISEAGSQEGAGWGLRASSSFISEACGRAKEQPSACRWVSVEGDEALLVPSGLEGCWPHPGARRTKDISKEGRMNMCELDRGWAPSSPAVSHVPIWSNCEHPRWWHRWGEPKGGT